MPAVASRPLDPRKLLLPRTTQRIALRRLSVADLPAFQAYRHDPAVGLYQGWSAQPDADALAFLNEMATAQLLVPGVWCQIGIADKESNALIGDIGICVAADERTAEIGFTLSAASQGKGLASEAVIEVIALLFERTPIGRAVSITDSRNLPALRLLVNVGMRQTAVVGTTFRGEPCTEHEFEIRRPVD